MQALLNKSHKITTDTRHEHKANKICFTILLFFSKKLCNEQAFK